MSTATDRQSSVGDWLEALKDSFRAFLRDDATGLSKQIAYSSLLAFFPAVAFVLGALGLFHLYDNVVNLLEPIVPSGVITFIDNLQQDSSGSTSAWAFVIGFVLAVWAASGAMNTIIKAVNRAYELQETRPVWRSRAIAIVLVLATGVTTAGVFTLIIVGGSLGDAIAKKAGLGSAFQWTWSIVRWPLAFCALLLFFSLVYYLGPDMRQRRWRWVTPGSLLGSALWLVLSGVFALYVKFAGNYTKTYGALASGIILLLWLNYSAFALLYGAELNSELDRKAEPARRGS